jgi:hypothetical protein
LQLVIFFYSLYFLTKEIRILVHILLGGLRVGHRVFAKQTQELFGSKKEIGILFHFFLGCFWQFSFFGAKEKPGFMVTGNRDFTSFFHEFCSWFRFSCSWLLSLWCIFLAWQEKRDLPSFFLILFFTVGYFLFNSVLSLSSQRKVRACGIN